MPKPKSKTVNVRGDAQLTARISTNQFLESDNEPDWSLTCSACGSRPVVPSTGMCGPCTFGEADTAGGNW